MGKVKMDTSQPEILNSSQKEKLLIAKNLIKYYPIRSKSLFGEKKFVKAVDDVSIFIKRRETLGIVGESGCGKTTLGKLLLRLLMPTSGKVYFEGTDIYALNKKEMRKIRHEMSLIYQDPFSSLNPRMNVGDIIGEPLYIQKGIKGDEKLKEVYKLLDVVGMPQSCVKKHPHEFSGGQRQRIGIARALIMRPKLIVCDEAVSALDVATQSQIINLLMDIQEQFGQAYAFIAHGLSVVKHISNRIAVMYLGKVVEIGGSDEIYKNPLHPYTQALFSVIPLPDPRIERKPILLEGDIPSPVDPPKGCRFHTRCHVAIPKCSITEPVFCETKLGSNHFVACHRIPKDI